MRLGFGSSLGTAAWCLRKIISFKTQHKFSHANFHATAVKLILVLTSAYLYVSQVFGPQQ